MKTSYILLFLLLAFLSLAAVSFVNEKEKRRSVVSKKLREMKFRVQEMEELVLEISQLCEDQGIAQFLNNEILSMITAMRQANPDAAHLEASYQTALLRGEAFAGDIDSTPLDRLKESDAQMARAKRALEEAAIILRRQQAAGKLAYEQMSQYLTDMSWAHLMVGAISNIGQGHKCQRRGDVLTAHAFYKKAQQQLMQSSHPDTRRHRMIKEISEMMSNKRLSISVDIMPETHLNPIAPAPVASVDTETANNSDEPEQA